MNMLSYLYIPNPKRRRADPLPHIFFLQIHAENTCTEAFTITATAPDSLNSFISL